MQGNEMLPNEAIIEYQQIYKQTYGKEISFEKAKEDGNKLVNLILLIERPNEMKYESPSTIFSDSK